MISQNSVKTIAKPIQGTSPPPHLPKMQDGIRPEHGGVKIIMSDCVPPCHQLVEPRSPPVVVSMGSVNIIPKRQAKPPKI